MPEKNPFRPGVGTRPVYLAGRGAEVRRFRSALRSAPEIPANIRLTGLRGVGKTVLLSEFERVAAEEGWATAQLELEPRHNTEATLTRALVAVAERSRERLSRATRLRKAVGRAVSGVGGIRVSYEDIVVSFDPTAGREDDDLPHALFDVTEAALDKGHTGFALLLDEAQVLRDESGRGREHPLSLLIAAVSALQKNEVPVSLVVCGLPTLTSNLLKARTYSERMFRGEVVASLEASEAREAFVRPLAETEVTASDDLVDAVLETVEGYPYFIQLWGAELWDAADQAGEPRLSTKLLRLVEPDIYRRLDVDFYEPRIQTLTPAEQDLLSAAARCAYPPLAVADIVGASDKTPGNVNVLLGRLVEAGVLYRLRKGQYEYTAPKFAEFLRRRSGHSLS